uniref:EF-hand domain-containing protein n=1 Tax=Noctiluca scintillans TaxID=2966 RepID=A0A7S0ZVT5_NOCSC
MAQAKSDYQVYCFFLHIRGLAMGNKVNKMLAAIDQSEDKDKVRRAMEELFQKYDTNNSGYLDRHGKNDQFELLLHNLVQYIEDEANRLGHVPEGFETETHDWIKGTMDANGDGKCSREEFMSSIEKVLHDEHAIIKEKASHVRTLGGSE